MHLTVQQGSCTQGDKYSSHHARATGYRHTPLVSILTHRIRQLRVHTHTSMELEGKIPTAMHQQQLLYLVVINVNQTACGDIEVPFIIHSQHVPVLQRFCKACIAVYWIHSEWGHAHIAFTMAWTAPSSYTCCCDCSDIYVPVCACVCVCVPACECECACIVCVCVRPCVHACVCIRM